jgi:hypothetical protein
MYLLRHSSAIVFFHLPNPFDLISNYGIFNSPFLAFIYAWLFFSVGGLSVKGGYALSSIYRGTLPKQALKTFIALNLYLLIFEGGTFVALALSYYGTRITTSAYFQSTHLFWISIGVFIFFYTIYLQLRRHDLLKWQALTDIKAIPFVSPAFCFGMPLVFKTNMAPVVLDAATYNKYVIMSFASGLIFAIYCALYAVHNHKFSITDAKSSNAFILPTSSDAPSADKEKYAKHVTSICFGLLGCALFLLLVTTLDLIVLLASGTMQPIPTNPPGIQRL